MAIFSSRIPNIVVPMVDAKGKISQAWYWFFRVLGGDAFETGDLKYTATDTAPTGWLKCDGSAVSRTIYADLFAVIGTTYGAGDGVTTFNIPNGAALPVPGILWIKLSGKPPGPLEEISR